MASLTKKNKVACQVIFTLLVVSLLIEEVRKENKDENDNPAVQQCTAMIDELFTRADDATRAAMTQRIQAHRIKFTKRVSHLTTTSGLIGALRHLTGGIYRTKPGTRFDYIVSTFRTNLANMEDNLKFIEADAEEFHTKMRDAVKKIG